jgi:translocation and assembly module TamA
MNPRRNYNVALAVALLIALADNLLVARPSHAAEIAPVEVTIAGIEGEAKTNVLAALSIAHPRTRAIDEAEARRLHEKAEKEIGLALQPFGFYRPAVWSELRHEQGRWRARYEIDAGTPLRVDSLDVRILGPGADDEVFAQVLADAPLKHGDVLAHAAYDDLRESLTNAAMKNGYLDARFMRHEMRVDLERYVSAVILWFDTGPRWVFGPVTFVQDVVDPDLVQGYVTFQRGEPADLGRLLELEQALSNSALWSRVDVRPRRDLARSEELPIVVTLEAAKPEKYTVGVGYGTDNGPHATALIELRRLNRRAHGSDLQLTWSTIEKSAMLKYRMPWPYPRTDVLTFSTGYTETREVTSTQQTALAGVHLSRLWAGWQEAFALQYRREKWEVGIDNARSGFLVPEASWNRLRTNDPIDPTRGRRLAFRVAGAHEQVFSAASYLKLEALAKWIEAPGQRHRLIGRIEGGQTWTNSFHELPPSVRFFAGGASSVRGFEYHRLGPRDAGGNVSGGTTLLVGSIEYEFRLFPQWGVAAFYDTGNAWMTFGGPLSQGIGSGLRWVSPVGLVRADFAVPIPSSRTVQFHVSIGPPL